MTIKKDLLALNKDLKALSRKMDRLLKAVEKSEKAEATRASATRTVKIKTTKSAPAKKVSTKKRTVGPTANDQVLWILNRSKKGVDASTLMSKTGFNQKKVWNILHRMHKNGKIKRVGKGLYVGVKVS